MNSDPIFNRAKVEEWRQNAVTARRKAGAETDGSVRNALAEIAQHWDRLASEIDRICDALDE